MVVRLTLEEGERNTVDRVPLILPLYPIPDPEDGTLYTPEHSIHLIGKPDNFEHRSRMTHGIGGVNDSTNRTASAPDYENQIGDYKTRRIQGGFFFANDTIGNSVRTNQTPPLSLIHI